MYVFLSDVTEAESSQHEKVRMSRLLQAVPGGMAVCNGSEIQFANEEFLKLLDISGSQIRKKNIPDILSETISADGNALREMKNLGKPVMIEWARERDGAQIWYEARMVPVPGEPGMPGLFACFLRDVTEDRVQKAQFYQAQKLEALGQLAGGVAHDFNNLLSIVDGYARMALKHVDKDNQAWNYLERIKQANRRGANLTKQLLTFGRHRIVADTVMDLKETLKDQEVLLCPLLDASIRMSIHADSGIFIDCSQDSMAQVLMNLVINSRDAMPDGGTITIDLQRINNTDLPSHVPEDLRHGDFCRLTVMDTGHGMDSETISRIFDPFYTTKEQGKGTGLGLSMVYGIVRQASGFIDVQSALGEGTSMKVYLPVSKRRPVARQAIPASPANPAGAMFNGYSVLVVEDEPDLLLVVKNMLQDMGMDVITAGNGNDALLKQDEYEGRIDFLLTDVVMPELNGVRLSEMMGELRPETKVIFMSGYPASGTMARIQVPEDAVLMAKPVVYEKLAGVLFDRLNNKAKSGDDIYRWKIAEAI
ncbi:MAG: response regulator [Proteobacteria bacterium]|nr:response regulator [Pseudomonadota bacterium]